MTVTNAKTWLITGGTGFIGKALVKRLLADDHSVIILTRNRQKASHHMPAGAALIDTLDDISDDQRVDSIVNLAGEPLFGGLWTQKRKQAFLGSRIGVTTQLVSLVDRLHTKPSVVISGSAIGYYGMSPVKEFDETSAPGDDEMAKLCLAWEDAAAPMASDITRLACLRTGLVLDPSGGMLAPLVLSTKLGMGAKLGDGQQWMSWISLRDIVRLIIFIAENEPVSGAINGTAPEPVQQLTFSDRLADHLNRPRFLTIPGAPLRFALGDMADLLLNGQKVLPQKAIAAGFTFQDSDLQQAFA